LQTEVNKSKAPRFQVVNLHSFPLAVLWVPRVNFVARFGFASSKVQLRSASAQDRTGSLWSTSKFRMNMKPWSLKLEMNASPQPLCGDLRHDGQTKQILRELNTW